MKELFEKHVELEKQEEELLSTKTSLQRQTAQKLLEYKYWKEFLCDCFLLNSVEELDKHIHDKDELRVEFSNTCCSLKLFDICVYFDDFHDDCLVGNINIENLDHIDEIGLKWKKNHKENLKNEIKILENKINNLIKRKEELYGYLERD